MMLKKVLPTVSILSLILITACKIHLTAPNFEFIGELGIEGASSDPCEDAKSLGSVTVTMEDGTVLKGEAFDCDGDGVPDQFKPDKGQGGDTSYGETDGATYYPLTPA